MTLDETALLEAVRAGDEAAFATVIGTHCRAVRAACARQAPPAEVDDCVQAVFLVLHRRAAAAARAPALLAWLLRVAHFVCRDARRAAARRQRSESIAVSSAPAGGHHPEAAVLDRLDAALQRLDERQRAALVMHVVAGESPAAVAQRLGVSQAHAYKLIQRGIGRLRAMLHLRGAPVGATALVALMRPPAEAATLSIPRLIALVTAPPAPGVACLARGAITAMTIANAASWLTAAALAIAVIGGAIAVGQASASPRAPAAHALAPPAPAPAAGAPAAATAGSMAGSLDRRPDALRAGAANPPVAPDGTAVQAAAVAPPTAAGARAAAAEAAPDQDPFVTLRVERMQARYIAEFLGKLTNATVTVDPTLAVMEATLDLQEVPLSKAVGMLADALRGQAEPVPGASGDWRILPGAEPIAPTVVQ